MSGREILTFQIGHYANFIGTHWWNIQESSFIYNQEALKTSSGEIDHNVLFREGLTLKGETTFVPRLVSLDLRGSLKTLCQTGTLYSGRDRDSDGVKWSGDVTLHESPALHKNEFLCDLDQSESLPEKCSDGRKVNFDQSGDGSHFEHGSDNYPSNSSPRICAPQDDKLGRKLYNLDSSVEVWSDFQRVHLHPRSIQLINDFTHGSTDQSFSIFAFGGQSLSGERWDQLEDRIRFFTEECDFLQGFHMLFDSHNGFGGAATKLVNYLNDEFPRNDVLAVPTMPVVSHDYRRKHHAEMILNSAFCTALCGYESSLYLPLSLAESMWGNIGGASRTLSHLSYNPDLDYHTSAILASVLDTMSLAYRMENGGTHLTDITRTLTPLGRKVAMLCTSFPFLFCQEGCLGRNFLQHNKELLWTPLTPEISQLPDPIAQYCTIRGISRGNVKRQRAFSVTRFLFTAVCYCYLVTLFYAHYVCYLHFVTLVWTFCRTFKSYPGQTSSSFTSEIFHQYINDAYPRSVNASWVVSEPLSIEEPFPHIFLPSVGLDGQTQILHWPSDVGDKSVPLMTSIQSNTCISAFVNSIQAEAEKINIKRHHHFEEAGLKDEYREVLNVLSTLADCYKSRHTSL